MLFLCQCSCANSNCYLYMNRISILSIWNLLKQYFVESYNICYNTRLHENPNLPWYFSGIKSIVAILFFPGCTALTCGVYGGSIRCPAPGYMCSCTLFFHSAGQLCTYILCHFGLTCLSSSPAMMRTFAPCCHAYKIQQENGKDYKVDI